MKNGVSMSKFSALAFGVATKGLYGMPTILSLSTSEISNYMGIESNSISGLVIYLYVSAVSYLTTSSSAPQALFDGYVYVLNSSSPMTVSEIGPLSYLVSIDSTPTSASASSATSFSATSIVYDVSDFRSGRSFDLTCFCVEILLRCPNWGGRPTFYDLEESIF